MQMLVGFIFVAALVWYVIEHRQRSTRAMPGGIDKTVSIPHSQIWELYHNDFSLCSKKIRVCLAELDIGYKSHHIDLIETGSYQNLSRAFLKVNPGATVPVLIHQGHPIYESHEQLKYSASHAANPYLLIPKDPEKKSIMEYWVHKTSLVGDDPIAAMNDTAGNAIPGLTLPIFSAMMTYIPYYRIAEGLLFHRLKKRALFFMVIKLFGIKRLTKMKPLLKVIEQSVKAMHRHLQELERVLANSDGKWIVGDQFTLADVGMMVIFDRLLEVDWIDEFITTETPNLRNYWNDLQDRDSYAAAIDQFSHPTVVRGKAIIVDLKQGDEDFRKALHSNPIEVDV